MSTPGPRTRTPRFRIRLTEDDIPELYCHGCQEWWPVTIECWPSRTSFWRCRACEAERSRLYQARKRLDPEGYIQNINKSRRYRAYLRDEEPELLPAVDAEKREREAAAARWRRSEKRRSYNRDWMRRNRARKRAAALSALYPKRAQAA